MWLRRQGASSLVTPGSQTPDKKARQPCPCAQMFLSNAEVELTSPCHPKAIQPGEKFPHLPTYHGKKLSLLLQGHLGRQYSALLPQKKPNTLNSHKSVLGDLLRPFPLISQKLQERDIFSKGVSSTALQSL